MPRSGTELRHMPLQHEKPEATKIHIEWERFHGCFLFMVDCQPLSDIINGRIPLKCLDLEETLADTLHSVEKMLDCGWQPCGLWTDPVKWVPREHNVVADFLCNYSMDTCKTWHQISDLKLPDQFNLLLHSDGGARRECGSASWVVEAAFYDDGERKLQLIAMSGTFYQAPVSSFTAEALALYHAVKHTAEFIRKI